MLRELDVQLVIHDFGAGQIRLAELNEISPAVVKFDCALIQGIDKANQKRHRLVAAMAKMCTELGITPMAEYIETESEHVTLQQLGFKLAQGFHYGHPATLDAIVGSSAAPNQRLDSADQNEAFFNEAFFNELQQLVDEATNESVTEADVQLLPEILAPPKTVKDAKWLKQQPDDHYAIQVMLSSTREQADEFVKNQSREKSFAIYRKMGRTREWYVVVYGPFEHREVAKTESEKFDSDTVSSWVRNISAIKRDIHTIRKKESMFGPDADVEA